MYTSGPGYVGMIIMRHIIIERPKCVHSDCCIDCFILLKLCPALCSLSCPLSKAESANGTLADSTANATQDHHQQQQAGYLEEFIYFEVTDLRKDENYLFYYTLLTRLVRLWPLQAQLLGSVYTVQCTLYTLGLRLVLG